MPGQQLFSVIPIGMIQALRARESDPQVTPGGHRGVTCGASAPLIRTYMGPCWRVIPRKSACSRAWGAPPRTGGDPLAGGVPVIHPPYSPIDTTTIAVGAPGSPERDRRLPDAQKLARILPCPLERMSR